MTNDVLGACCIFEGDDVSFPEIGFALAVLQPGQSGGLYHREFNQEDFLVLVGESIVYPRSELALRHGAGVETETTKPAEAYAPFPRWEPGKPDFSGLPWA